MDKEGLDSYSPAMELVLLKTLVVLSEVGGFTAAADRLCVTQSAVSRRIQQLEIHYGVKLVTRGAEVVTPTAEGRVLVNKARRILELQEEMDEAVTGLKMPRQIRMCCTPCFGLTRLPGILKPLAGVFESLDINVSFRLSEAIVSGLLSGQYDLAAM